jgi:hypothetical protein
MKLALELMRLRASPKGLDLAETHAVLSFGTLFSCQGAPAPSGRDKPSGFGQMVLPCSRSALTARR